MPSRKPTLRSLRALSGSAAASTLLPSTTPTPPARTCLEGMQRIPQRRFSVRYDTSAALPDGWSGVAPWGSPADPATAGTGSFIRGRLPEAAQNLILATAKRKFQVVDGPLKPQPKRTTQDADLEDASDEYEDSLKMMGKWAPAGVLPVPASTVGAPAASPSLAGVSTPVSVLLATPPPCSKSSVTAATPHSHAPLGCSNGTKEWPIISAAARHRLGE
ncbi:hypothetical protein DL765_002689 [Monosporascus sp. GIB2]|nr:hypothetical protein DL765_002689 [Monosporascus sp. GIB2]